MSEAQSLWWEQAKSDLAVFLLLRREGCHACHLLHYLQMATEKLAKAYLWRSGQPPERAHIGLMRFMRALVSRGGLSRIAAALGFAGAADMKGFVRRFGPLAYALHRLAPAAANDGPNAEYPWPHAAPAHCPATHRFQLWAELSGQALGRRFMLFVERAVERFDQYA